jgi:hypothetical protein
MIKISKGLEQVATSNVQNTDISKTRVEVFLNYIKSKRSRNLLQKVQAVGKGDLCRLPLLWLAAKTRAVGKVGFSRSVLKRSLRMKSSMLDPLSVIVEFALICRTCCENLHYAFDCILCETSLLKMHQRELCPNSTCTNDEFMKRMAYFLDPEKKAKHVVLT